MYKLHIANKNYSSWSLRPWLLLRELNIPFEEILHPFGGEVKFTEFSANGKVPCLHDASIEVWDSLAICEYLAESDDRVWPSDRAARAWARSVVAEMHSGFESLRNICDMNIAVRIALHEMPAGLIQDLERIQQIWQEGITTFGGPFLAGKQITAVDAFFAPVVFRCQSYHLPLTTEADSYCQLLLSLVSMQEWQAQALTEVWRDDDHEIAKENYGKLVTDLRLA